MRDRIHDLASSRREAIIARLTDLIRIDTRNRYCGDDGAPGEIEGQRYLEPLLESLGARTKLFDCPADIYARMGVIGPEGRDFTGRPNLVAEWDFGRPGPRIIVNGHMDTVGVEGMAIEPFAAELSDGFIWGRGAGDCKGGIACAVEAIGILMDLGLPMGGSLVFQSVAEEESSGSGAGTLACLDAGYTGDLALFVDGNSLSMTLGCGGCLTADLDVTGKMGHAAAGTGVSAIEKALVIKRGIDAFKAEREAQVEHRRVNLGILNAGVHAAVVPGSAYMSLNIVYDVQEAEAARARGLGWGGAPIRARFEELIRAAEAEDAWLSEHPSGIVWVKDLAPFDQPADDPWVQRLAGVCAQVLGAEPAFGYMTAWSDAAWPAALGGIPTVLFGPSISGQSHGPEEHIRVDDLVRCTEVIAAFLADALAVT